MLLYKLMVLPYIEYADCFMIGCNEGDRVKIQRIQNKGLKIALERDRYYSTAQLHLDGKIATWEVRTNATMCRMKHTEEYIVMGVDTRLHEGPIFRMDIPKNNTYARSTSYMSRKTWNLLPGWIRIRLGLVLIIMMTLKLL